MQTYTPDQIRGHVPDGMFLSFKSAFDMACDAQRLILHAASSRPTSMSAVTAINRQTEISKLAAAALMKVHRSVDRYLKSHIV